MKMYYLIYQNEDETFQDAYIRQKFNPVIAKNRDHVAELVVKMKADSPAETKILSIPVQVNLYDRVRLS